MYGNRRVLCGAVCSIDETYIYDYLTNLLRVQQVITFSPKPRQTQLYIEPSLRHAREKRASFGTPATVMLIGGAQREDCVAAPASASRRDMCRLRCSHLRTMKSAHEVAFVC